MPQTKSQSQTGWLGIEGHRGTGRKEFSLLSTFTIRQHFSKHLLPCTRIRKKYRQMYFQWATCQVLFWPFTNINCFINWKQVCALHQALLHLCTRVVHFHWKDYTKAWQLLHFCFQFCVRSVRDAYSSPCILVLDQQKVPESGRFHISEASSASPPLEKPLAWTECSELASSAFWETHAHTQVWNIFCYVDIASEKIITQNLKHKTLFLNWTKPLKTIDGVFVKYLYMCTSYLRYSDFKKVVLNKLFPQHSDTQLDTKLHQTASMSTL